MKSSKFLAPALGDADVSADLQLWEEDRANVRKEIIVSDSNFSFPPLTEGQGD